MSDVCFMRLALRLARRGYGMTSPNPMVGAVLVKGGKIIGRGWHRRAGGPHAEIEALRDAQKQGRSPRGATLYVTLEPCCTHGLTPPCTAAIIAAGIKRLVVGASDPNPKHAGMGFRILKRAGIEIALPGSAIVSPASCSNHAQGARRRDAGDMRALAAKCECLNEAFNHWIVHRTPFVTVKAAMTLDGKIATARGESKWITSEQARVFGLKLRRGADAVLVGINTILADDPSLTVRCREPGVRCQENRVRRIVLDSLARTPLTARVVSDEHAAMTTIVVGRQAPKVRVAGLARHVNVLVAPLKMAGSVTTCAPMVGKSHARRAENCAPCHQIDLPWLLKKLGAENVTSLLVEGGGEVNASFLLGGFAQRVAFFYAPKILGGGGARKGVAGDGVNALSEVIQLREVEWRRLGPDLLLTARLESKL